MRCVLPWPLVWAGSEGIPGRMSLFWLLAVTPVRQAWSMVGVAPVPLSACHRFVALGGFGGGDEPVRSCLGVRSTWARFLVCGFGFAVAPAFPPPRILAPQHLPRSQSGEDLLGVA